MIIGAVVGLLVVVGAIMIAYQAGSDSSSSDLATAEPGDLRSTPQPNSGAPGEGDQRGSSAAPESSSTRRSPSTTMREPTLLPDVSADRMQTDIQAVLLDFHRAVIAADFQTAWSLLSERKREDYNIDPEKGGYPGFERSQGSLSPYLDPTGISVEVQTTDPATGEATVMVRGMRWNKAGAPCVEWSGITWVIFEGGHWRYDPGYSTTPAREAVWEPRVGELLGVQCSE